MHDLLFPVPGGALHCNVMQDCVPVIKSFTVGAKHHVNLGDYESMEIEGSISIEMKDGESIIPARIRAQELLRDLLAETFAAQYKPSWFERIMTKQRKQTQNIQQITEKAR